ncbi:phosphatase PAP2 family protein [Trinickia sp.]|uniref:phosphatase PAP2 family protein n=1 Tax=Trinickia sp. TaxID=2571163 RepID=UPI003F7F28EC
MTKAVTRIRVRTRLGMMAIGWGTVGLCYSIGRIAPGTAHVLHERALDRVVPFDASAIWLYLSFFLFVPVAYLCALPDRLAPLTRAMQCAAVLAGIVFVAWPTTLVYPLVPTGTTGAAALHWLVDFDSTRNCMPSLHGALTLLCMVAMWQRERPWRTAFMFVWGLAVMWSVVAARRHLAVDLGAGLLLGVLCAGVVAYLSAKARQPAPFNPSPEVHP